MPDFKDICMKEIFPSKQIKRFFLKCRSKEKVLYSFTSENESVDQEKSHRSYKSILKQKIKNIQFEVIARRFHKCLSFLYLVLIIFSKDILYIFFDKGQNMLADTLTIVLIILNIVETIFHLSINTSYIYYFMFFDVLSLIMIFGDLSICENYVFNYLCSSFKNFYRVEDISNEEIFYLLQLFKALKVTKIYRLVIKIIKDHTKDKYEHRNEWNFEKMESMKNKTDLKDNLKFTNKMHLTLIKRFFVSLIFIMISYILIELATFSKGNKSSMSYFIYNIDRTHFDDHYESEFLKALHFYSNIQRTKNDEEYLISFKSKRKLQNYVNKKEINIGKEKHILWDFTKLSYVEMTKLLDMKIPNEKNEEEIVLDSTIQNSNQLRHYEIKVYKSKDFIFYINIKKKIIKKIKNIVILKIFIILFSFFMLFYFSVELNILLFPIESILKKLKLMKSNPTLALEMQEELLNHELDNILRTKQLKKECIKGNYEILKMEENLMKLGTLMLLGFGEAGAKIISKNINDQERINLLINGEIVYSVFSFCDIRNFTEITEILKEKIMIFINLVAEIIHECCDFYDGSINKNIGDAFLLVWKYKKNYGLNKSFSNQEYAKTEVTSYENYSEKKKINRICDLAFLSTIKTLIKLKQSEKIRAFLKSEKIDELINKNIIELSFGLHFGWAIEGAIGSRYKIDLSYLSENVNIASRLQDISKIYKTNIIISGDFYDNMSEGFKKSLRKIDRVTLKGCANPLYLYTVDLCLNKIQNEKTISKFETIGSTSNSDRKMTKIFDDIKKKTERRRRKKQLSNLDYDLFSEYTKSSDIRLVKVEYPEEYLHLFEQSLELYLNGKWSESKKLLDHLKNKFYFEDNVVYQLFDFLSSNNFTTPYDWPGYRMFLHKS
ncbi:adenylyl cyclase alpha, putative [Plasmodium vinckei]|uniref:Adenylyl cyclase alpha, putative n=1 Tax=Plasmodium vinckei TaxID=5860 RepID=A0A6V7T3S8_PLAVN|nr:adenylyl cyclase alpha, putative [Plasmodium vinckei]